MHLEIKGELGVPCPPDIVWKERNCAHTCVNGNEVDRYRDAQAQYNQKGTNPWKMKQNVEITKGTE